MVEAHSPDSSNKCCFLKCLHIWILTQTQRYGPRSTSNLKFLYFLRVHSQQLFCEDGWGKATSLAQVLRRHSSISHKDTYSNLKILHLSLFLFYLYSHIIFSSHFHLTPLYHVFTALWRPGSLFSRSTLEEAYSGPHYCRISWWTVDAWYFLSTYSNPSLE
jgi:hypothetical protein